jgi:hypothetical protein
MDDVGGYATNYVKKHSWLTSVGHNLIQDINISMSSLEEYNAQALPIDNPNDYVAWLNSISDGVLTKVTSRNEVDYVAGCSSPVWITGAKNTDGTYSFTFLSDSKFVNGIGKILTDVYGNKTKQEILQIKFRDFDNITRFLLFERKRSFQKFINKIYSIALSD